MRIYNNNSKYKPFLCLGHKQISRLPQFSSVETAAYQSSFINRIPQLNSNLYIEINVP